jgi:hypothetical protein
MSIDYTAWEARKIVGAHYAKGEVAVWVDRHQFVGTLVEGLEAPTKLGPNGQGQSGWRVYKRWTQEVSALAASFMFTGALAGGIYFGVGLKLGGIPCVIASGLGGITLAVSHRTGKKMVWVTGVKTYKWDEATWNYVLEGQELHEGSRGQRS